MMTTRPLTSDDFPVMDAILQAAFGNPLSYQPRLARFLGLGPGNWVLAEVDGRPAGMGGFNLLGRTAYVGMVVTDPQLQGRGIGTAVMRRVLELARERGCGTVLLDASPAGKPLYEKLGFVSDDQVGHWKRPAEGASGTAAPSPASPSAPPPEAGHPDTPRVETFASLGLTADGILQGEGGSGPAAAIARLDRGAWGDDRSRFLAAYAADDPGLAAAVRGTDGEARGYLIFQEASGNLGPWVADDGAAGSALLDWALRLEAARRELNAYVPGRNAGCRSLLAERGFRETRTLTHMRLGQALPARRRSLVWGQANLAVG